jgi:hypothetical protein
MLPMQMLCSIMLVGRPFLALVRTEMDAHRCCHHAAMLQLAALNARSNSDFR